MTTAQEVHERFADMAFVLNEAADTARRLLDSVVESPAGLDDRGWRSNVINRLDRLVLDIDHVRFDFDGIEAKRIWDSCD